MFVAVIEERPEGLFKLSVYMCKQGSRKRTPAEVVRAYGRDLIDSEINRMESVNGCKLAVIDLTH